jgi:hypothetical protein
MDLTFLLATNVDDKVEQCKDQNDETRTTQSVPSVRHSESD